MSKSVVEEVVEEVDAEVPPGRLEWGSVRDCPPGELEQRVGTLYHGPIYWRHAEAWTSRLGQLDGQKDFLRVRYRNFGDYSAMLVGHLPDGKFLCWLPIDRELRVETYEQVVLSARRGTFSAKRMEREAEEEQRFLKAAEKQFHAYSGRHQCSHCGRRGHKKTTCGERGRTKEEVEAADDAERRRLSRLGFGCDAISFPEDEQPRHAWEEGGAPKAWKLRLAELELELSPDHEPLPRKRAGRKQQKRKQSATKDEKVEEGYRKKFRAQAGEVVGSLRGMKRRLWVAELMVMAERVDDMLFELKQLLRTGASHSRFSEIDKLLPSESESDSDSEGEGQASGSGSP